MVLPSPVRSTFARTVRSLLRVSPRSIRDNFRHLPQTRFAPVLPKLFEKRQVITWRGIQVEVNPGEMLGYYPFFLGDYATCEINTLISLCRTVETAACNLFDIGANIGLVSLSVARAVAGVNVYSFEPCSAVCRRFMENVDRNRPLDHRVHLIKKALSNREGKVDFAMPGEDNPEVGRISDSGAAGQPTEQVDVTRLDKFCDSAGTVPSIIKLDAEGEELNILRGMPELLAKKTPLAIQMELHAFFYANSSHQFKQDVGSHFPVAAWDMYVLEQGRWEPLKRMTDAPDRSQILALRNWPTPAPQSD